MNVPTFFAFAWMFSSSMSSIVAFSLAASFNLFLQALIGAQQLQSSLNLVLGLEASQLLDLELAHEIRAEPDQDARRSGELDRILAGLQHFGVLSESDLGHAHVAATL